MEKLLNESWTRSPNMHKHLAGIGKIESEVSCILPATTFNGSGLLRQEGYDGVYSCGSSANFAVANLPLYAECPTGFYVKGALDMEPDLKTIKNIHLLKLEKL